MENSPSERRRHRGNIYSVLRAALLCVITLLIFKLYRPQSSPPAIHSLAPSNHLSGSQNPTSIANAASRSPLPLTPPRTAEQIVADKLIAFGASRREIVDAMSRHYGEPIPEEVLRFFDAVAAGNWPEIERLFESMAKRSGQYNQSGPPDPALNHFWPAVLETFGVAEQAHDIPAAELLQFGEDVLGAVPPGAVYIGGTDSGRFIPTLLAETSSGERPIVLTQNAFADSRYLEYIQFLYGNRLDLPTPADSERVIAEYKADARKRLDHDEQFPDEPRQVRHLETIKLTGENIDVSGPTAVMDVNERFLKLILERNPDYAFALQESFPLKGTYAEATPAGPIMELCARDPSEPLTADAANAVLDYWRNYNHPPSDAGGAPPSEETLKNYSHMAAAQANLLAHQGHPATAEQIYKTSFQIYPRNIDTLLNYRRLLLDQQREAEAARLLQTFRTQHPDLESELNKWLPP